MPGLPSAEAAKGRKTLEQSSAKATGREEPEFEHVSEKAGEQAPQQVGTQAGEPYSAKDCNCGPMNMHARRKANMRASDRGASERAKGGHQEVNQSTNEGKCERMTE